MEQRDYMMRQIEQLGQVLARMLARLLHIKQVPDAGLSLDKTTDNEASRELREKSIIILEHLQVSSGNYSMARINRISQLREFL